MKAGPSVILGHVLAVPDGEQENDYTECGRFSHLARPNGPHVDPHEHGGRNRDGNRERPPGAFAQRFHDDQAERGKDNDHNAKGANEGNAARDRTHFHFHHFTE